MMSLRMFEAFFFVIVPKGSLTDLGFVELVRLGSNSKLSC